MGSKLVPVIGFSLMAVLVLGPVARADTFTVSASGTWDAAAPTTTWTAPNETWSFSFLIDKNPAVSEVSSIGFNAAFSHFMYKLNGSSVDTTPVAIRFFNGGSYGGINVDFDAGSPPVYDADPYTGFAFFGFQAFSGATSSPTVPTGMYTAGAFPGGEDSSFISDGSSVQDVNGTQINVTPEPTSLSLMLIALAIVMIALPRLRGATFGVR